MDTQDLIPVDSVVLGADGRFSFKFPAENSGFWILQADNGKIVVLVLHPGERITITGNAKIFPDDILIDGAGEAVELHRFFTETRMAEKSIDSLEQALISHQDEEDYYDLTQDADELLRTIWAQQRTREINYIEKNPSRLSSLIVINYAFGIAPVIGMEEDFQYYLMLDSTLSAAMPANKHVQFHKQRMVTFRPKQP
jgi:hypothetical protein